MLAPLTAECAARLADYFAAAGYPVRAGTHTNSAFALTLDVVTGEAIEHIVDLARNEIVARKVIPNREAPYGQPSVMLEEFFKCEAVVKADPGWRAAMVRRGLTDEDIELVQVDP